MFPNLSSVVSNWTSPVLMKVISQVPVDFEPSDVVEGQFFIEMMVTPTAPQKIDRKSEGTRAWRWLDYATTSRFWVDMVIEDPDGYQYRVDSVADWSRAGFYKGDMVQQPKNLVDLSEEF